MSTERLFWDLVKASGKNHVSRLPDSFNALGKKGNKYFYRQIFKTQYGFIYEVTETVTKEVHYEVFRRIVVDKQEVYPWQEPLANEVYSSTNKGNALHILKEITDEGYNDYTCNLPPQRMF